MENDQNIMLGPGAPGKQLGCASTPKQIWVNAAALFHDARGLGTKADKGFQFAVHAKLDSGQNPSYTPKEPRLRGGSP